MVLVRAETRFSATVSGERGQANPMAQLHWTGAATQSDSREELAVTQTRHVTPRQNGTKAGLKAVEYMASVEALDSE